MNYLTLIRSIALLHQHQRAAKTLSHGGEVLEYIEVVPEDIATANRLCSQVLARSRDELPPQTRRLLEPVSRMVSEGCERLKTGRSDYRSTRREVREYTGWSDYDREPGGGWRGGDGLLAGR